MCKIVVLQYRKFLFLVFFQFRFHKSNHQHIIISSPLIANKDSLHRTKLFINSGRFFLMLISHRRGGTCTACTEWSRNEQPPVPESTSQKFKILSRSSCKSRTPSSSRRGLGLSNYAFNVARPLRQGHKAPSPAFNADGFQTTGTMSG